MSTRFMRSVKTTMFIVNSGTYSRRKTFVASYSEFWESLNGVKKGALYHLPSQVMRKAPESIPSKKRAEYRKRYHILDTIIQEVNSLSR